MESGGNDVLGSLDQILLSLEGTTTLEKPKVSRDVMVEVLKEHTELIRSLCVDLRAANEAISMQTEALIECRKVMASMNDEIKRGKAETNSLRKVTTKLTEDTKDIRQDMGITQVKIAGLGNIMELEQITHRLSADYTEFKKETKTSVESLRERNKEVDVKLVEVKKMVKETGQTLTLPSSQIMVESMVEGQGPCKLAEVLTDYAASMDATKALLQEQLAKIESNATELSLKAEATITIDIDALYSRMHAAEALLKRDSEQGVSVS